MELAVQKDPKNAEGIANLLVLNSISGNNTDELVEYVFHHSFVIEHTANRSQITEAGKPQPPAVIGLGREEQPIR